MDKIVSMVPTFDAAVKEITYECGCVYIVREYPKNPLYPNFTASASRFKFKNGEEMICETHKREKIDEENHRLGMDELAFKNATELKCDWCGETMGYVSENDLNGSAFYCLNCKNNGR